MFVVSVETKVGKLLFGATTVEEAAIKASENSAPGREVTIHSRATGQEVRVSTLLRSLKP